MIEDIDIHALKEGSESAFRTLVETFQNRVFNTCLGFLETREEAEDAAQETFIEIFSSIKNFREEAQLSTWIYRIAVTKSLQVIRKKKTKKRFALFFSTNENENMIDSAIDTGQRHPLEQLEDKERATILYRTMKQLPETQRIAFTLHKIEGLDYKTISEVMSLSVPSVESLIHRAKINMQKRLLKYYRAQNM